MAKASKQGIETSPGSKVKAAAKAEKRLLKEEARAAQLVDEAERRLTKATAKLSKVSAQFDNRRAELLAAEDELRRCQTARGKGPTVDNSGGQPVDSPPPPESDASPLPEPAEGA